MEIIFFWFIIGMFISLSILYYMFPEPKLIIKEPNIYDDKSAKYVDDKGVCYKYSRHEVNCLN